MNFRCKCSLEDISSCGYSEIRDEINCKHVCMFPFSRARAYTLYAYHMTDKMTFPLNI